MRRTSDPPMDADRSLTSTLLRQLGGYPHRLFAVAGPLLSIGLLLAVLGLFLLAALTVGVIGGKMLGFDQAVLLWLDAHASPWLDVAALEVTSLLNTLVVALLTLVAGTLLWLTGRRDYATLLTIAVVGCWTLVRVLKIAFDRPRPQLFEWRATIVANGSYPSGHATMSMVLLLVLAYIVHRLAEGRRWPGVLAFALAAILVLLTGLSRLYLGVHYPTDVLAGFAVGFVWVVFCTVVVEVIRREHLARVRVEARR